MDKKEKTTQAGTLDTIDVNGCFVQCLCNFCATHKKTAKNQGIRK
ncbi:hypothetical protein ACQKIC_20235 [Peribacillus sp. NPDC046944]